MSQDVAPTARRVAKATADGPWAVPVPPGATFGPVKWLLLVLLIACPAKPSADALVADAERLLDEGPDGDAATLSRVRDLAQEATQLDPQNDRAWALLGLALYDSERALDLGVTADRAEALRQAESHWRRALDLNPKNVDALIGLARIVAEPGTEDALLASIDLLKRGTEAVPQNVDLWLYLGIAWFDLARYAEAERALLEATKTHGDEPEVDTLAEAERYLGRIYTDQKRFPEAEAHLKKSIAALDVFRAEEETDNGCPYQALGRLYAQMGRHDAVWALYETAADIAEHTPVHLYIAALKSYEFGEHERAAAYLDRAEQADGRHHPRVEDASGRYHTLRGYLALAKQDTAEARRRFEAAKALDPDGSAVGLGHLAIVELDHAAAAAQFAPVLAWDMDQRKQGLESTVLDVARFTYKMAGIGRAWVHANAGDHDEALRWFDVVLADQPDEVLALLGRGNSLLALGRDAQALVAFDRVLAMQDGNRYARSGRAAVLANRGESEAAEAEYRAAASAEGYTCPHRGLGLLYLKQGRVDEARGELEKAVSIDPELGYRKFVALARIYVSEARWDEADALLVKALQNRPDGESALALRAEIAQRRTP